MSKVQNDKKRNWLFVVQNFEIKTYKDSAARIEIVEPILASGFVNQHQILCFDRNYQTDYAVFVQQRINQIKENIKNEPVVIYGAGLHTEQHLEQLSALNIVAIADRDEMLWGQLLAGHPIISPKKITEYANNAIVSSKAFETSILQEMPKQVPAVNWHGLYPNSLKSDFFNKMASKVELVIDGAKKKQQPFDIVFFSPCHPQDSLPASYWLKLKSTFPEIKFITLWWDYDEFNASPYLVFERECLTWADCVVENSNITRLDNMKANLGIYEEHIGAQKVLFNPTVFSPELFYFERPYKMSKRKNVITLFGSPAGQRKGWIEFLETSFPEEFVHIGGVFHGEQPLSIEDYASALRNSLITVNTQTYCSREQCKGKVREALACGTLLLEQDNKQTRALLQEGEGVLYFSNKNQLKQLIEELIGNYDLISSVVDRGQLVCESRLNPTSWTKNILKTVG